MKQINKTFKALINKSYMANYVNETKIEVACILSTVSISYAI